MAKYETNSVGFKLVFTGPDTVEEYDNLAGKVGAALEDAVYNEIYRGTLPTWADAFADEVKKLTGIERGVNQTQTDKNQERENAAAAKASPAREPKKVPSVPETLKSYLARIDGSITDEQRKQLATTAQQVADATPVNPKPSERQGPGIRKDLLQKADQFLAGDSDTLEGKISVWTTSVADFELERDEAGKPKRDSLARLIGKYLDTLL